MGLLCCQDLTVATQSLIKLSCGLTERLINFNVEDYVSQMKDIATLSAMVKDVQDCFSTHPFNPLRVVALNHFWESTMLTDLLGHSPAKLSDQQMDEQIGARLGFMEPRQTAADSPHATRCLQWGCYWVAIADGTIDEAEIQAIHRLVGDQLAEDALRDIRNAPDPVALVRDRFQKAAADSVHRDMPANQRHVLIQNLIVVANANMEITVEERAVLRKICTALEVHPGFVEQILLLVE